MVKLEKDSIILVTGSKGLVGNSLIRNLRFGGFKNILAPTREELDLRDQKKVEEYFKNNRIDCVFHLAAKVAGFKVKEKAPADFFYDNLLVSVNTINSANNNNVRNLLFVGSACIYSVEAEQPLRENSLFSGALEGNNEGYALAKIAGLKLCEYFKRQNGRDYFGIVPCNLYGPNDHFDDKGHFIPKMIRKIHDAKEGNLGSIRIDGSGRAIREFLFVDDLSDAMIYFMKHKNKNDLMPFLNIGSGKEISISEVLSEIREVIGFMGEIKFMDSEEKTVSRRLLDTSRANSLGWKVKIGLKKGLKITYDWFLKNKAY